MKAHVFFKEGKLYLIPELPEQPNDFCKLGWDACEDRSQFRQNRYVCKCRAKEIDVEQAKANALLVANPELVRDDGYAVVNSMVGDFYEWPGTWEESYYCSKEVDEKCAKLIAPQQNSAHGYTEGADVPQQAQADNVCPICKGSGTYGQDQGDMCKDCNGTGLYRSKNLYEANKSLRDANKNLNNLLNDAEQRGEYKARHDLRNEIKSLRDQLSKEREKLEQAKCNNENAWKGVKQVCAEKYELGLKLEKEREMRKELLTKIKKICRGYVHYQDWTKFSYEFDIEIEKAASELDKKSS